jgi:hypothetical protein
MAAVPPTPEQAARVATWRAWCKRDAEHWRAYQFDEIDREQYVAEKAFDPEPPRPSDMDFKLADGRISDTVTGT